MTAVVPSPDLAAALDALWNGIDDRGLLPDLPLDATLARGRDLEAGSVADRAVVARLAELVVTGETAPVGTGDVDADDAFSRLVASVSGSGSGSGIEGWARSMLVLFDAWWMQTITAEPVPGDERAWSADPDVVLAHLARLGTVAPVGVRMNRWFEPWLAALDGPGTLHLADVVLNGLRGPWWAGYEDEAGQVLGWARTEPVLNGVTLIGGIHLEPERFSRLLDHLI